MVQIKTCIILTQSKDQETYLEEFIEKSIPQEPQETYLDQATLTSKSQEMCPEKFISKADWLRSMQELKEAILREVWITSKVK